MRYTPGYVVATKQEYGAGQAGLVPDEREYLQWYIVKYGVVIHLKYLSIS